MPPGHPQEIGQALLPSSGDSKSQPALAAATATDAPAAEATTESAAAATPQSPYTNVSVDLILSFHLQK